MKVLKTIYKAMGCVVLAASLSSCVNNWLDVAPSNGVDADGALVSQSDLTAARVGMYKALKGTSSMVDYYGQQFFVYGDVHAGDDYQYNNVGGSNRASFYYKMQYETASEFSSSNVAWQSPYVVIGRANRIIAFAENGKYGDDAALKAEAEQYAAEAKVLRALAHFDLVRIYGKPYTEDQGASLGVPLVTEVLESDAKPARSTVKEVYAQVVKDLTEAIDAGVLLGNYEECVGYISQHGAEALLSRVYLHMGDYANALAVAEKIINTSGATLWTRDQYYKAWSAESPNESEFLFRLSVTGSTDNNDLNGIGNLQQRDGYKEMVATKSFLDMLSSDPNDVRNQMFLAPDTTAAKEVAAYGKNKVYLNKLRGLNNNLRVVPVVPVIRLSEVYLTAAECAFRTNDKTKAAKYLNALIENRTTTEASKVTEASITLDRILIERRKELIGEGQRYFDALRCNETITRYTSDADKGWHATLSKEAQSFNRDYYKAIAAIPQDEINANPNIKQNDGYGE